MHELAAIRTNKKGKQTHRAASHVSSAPSNSSFCQPVFVGNPTSSSLQKPFQAHRFSPFLTKNHRFAEYFFRLCGKKFLSLLKDGNFLPQRKRKFGAEMLYTSISRRRFLTISLLTCPEFHTTVLRNPVKFRLCERKTQQTMTLCIPHMSLFPGLIFLFHPNRTTFYKSHIVHQKPISQNKKKQVQVNRKTKLN